MRQFFRVRSPLMQNTGSVARDHLASERTYLAWLRTGLGFVALGIAVERFNQLDIGHLTDAVTALTEAQVQTRAALSHSADEHRKSPVRKAGQGKTNGEATKRRDTSHESKSDFLVGALLGTGTGCITYGTTRYFNTLRLLEQGQFRPAYNGAAILGVGVAGLAGTVYWQAVKERTSH